MKKILFLLLFIPAFNYAQQKSCCKASSTEKFAMLGSDEKFVASHLSPLPFHFESGKGSMITFDATDGKKANAFEIKSAVESNLWLFVFHEWWGLNDYIKREAERLSNELTNVNVIAIDLYDGVVAENAGKAQETMQSLKDERARAIIQGAIQHAGPKAKIGTIGWCMGGGWSLQASIMAGTQGIVCVMYYGFPETDITKLKSLNAAVLGIFASKDNWITPEVVSTFETNMKSINKKLIVKTYEADHAFANPSNPKYNKEATEQANHLSLSVLKARLK